MAKGDTVEVPEIQVQVQGCKSYTVAFQSTIQMVFKGPGGGTAKISGKPADRADLLVRCRDYPGKRLHRHHRAAALHGVRFLAWRAVRARPDGLGAD